MWHRAYLISAWVAIANALVAALLGQWLSATLCATLGLIAALAYLSVWKDAAEL